MKRDEAKAIISAMVALRESATDEQALNAQALYPTWKPDVNYEVGIRILHGGVLYKVLQQHCSQADWTPDTSPSLFAKVLIPDPGIIPEWVQPDSTNGYSTGDKVTHNNKTWESTCNDNVWEPGTYGWMEVSQ